MLKLINSFNIKSCSLEYYFIFSNLSKIYLIFVTSILRFLPRIFKQVHLAEAVEATVQESIPLLRREPNSLGLVEATFNKICYIRE